MDDELFCFRTQRIVAAMNCLPNTACMCGGDRGCARQRADVSCKREQQQKSGDPAMHTVEVPKAYQVNDAESKNKATVGSGLPRKIRRVISAIHRRHRP